MSNQIIADFMNESNCPSYDRYWDLLMPVVDRINRIRPVNEDKYRSYNWIHMSMAMVDIIQTRDAIVEFLSIGGGDS